MTTKRSTVLLRVLGPIAIAGLVLGAVAVPAQATTKAPPAPKSVKAKSTSTTVTLTWKSGKGTTKGFNIYRSSSSSSSVSLKHPINGKKLVTKSTYKVTKLSPTKTYWFVVQSVNKNGKHAQAKKVKATLLPSPPVAPAVKAVHGDTTVALTWTPSTKGGAVASYQVYRSTTWTVGTAANLVTKTPLKPWVHGFNDSGLVNGTAYHYLVVATNAGGHATSATVTATPQIPAPGAPVLTGTRATGVIHLTWNASGRAASSWRVYKSTSLPVVTSGMPLATITNPATTHYDDTTVDSLGGYNYVVVGTNVGGSTSSNTFSSKPAAPSAPTATTTSNDASVDVHWTAGSGGGPVASWRVYRGTTASVNTSASATPLATVAAATLTYHDAAVTNGSTYYYAVVATNLGGSAASASVVANPQVAAPSAAVLSSTHGDGVVHLTWTAGAGGGAVASRTVYRSTSSSGVVAAGNVLAAGSSLPASTLSLDDSTVTNGTTYYYVVVTKNAGGSTNSNQVSQTPNPPQPANLTVSNPAAVPGSNVYAMSRMTYCLSTTSAGDIATCGTPLFNSLIQAKNPDNANAVTYFGVHDVATVHITNTGDVAATITGASIDGTSDPDSFQVDSAPTTIAGGASADVAVRFVYVGGATYGPVLRHGSLTITATGLPAITVPLVGEWQPGPNRSTDGLMTQFEPPLAMVVGAYGYTTDIGSTGLLDNDRGGQGQAFGDEVVSNFWSRADTSQPFTVQRLAAFSSSGVGEVDWYDTSTAQLRLSGCSYSPGQVCHLIAAAGKAETGTSAASPTRGQGLLPDNGTVYSVVPDSATFALKLGAQPGDGTPGDSSDDSRNDTTNDTATHGCTPASSCGHHVRFFPVKDANGAVVANTYIVTVDLGGVNNDFNDDVLIVSNITPAS